MSLFLSRNDFERACRVAGITELGTDPASGDYLNADTHKAFLVWDSVAQSTHARQRPPAWLIRRRGLDAAVVVQRPYTRATAEDWARIEQRGEQVLALYPAMPTSSPSADAVLAERQRQQSVKGYHPERDQRYVDGEMVRAAISYALQSLGDIVPDYLIQTFWPWPGAPLKDETPLRALEKAAALLIADHERLSVQTAES